MRGQRSFAQGFRTTTILGLGQSRSTILSLAIITAGLMLGSISGPEIASASPSAGFGDSAPGKVDPSKVYDVIEQAQNENLQASVRIEAIRYLANFPYNEVFAALLKTLTRSIDKIEDGTRRLSDIHVLQHTIAAIGDQATVYESLHVLEQFERLEQNVEMLPKSSQVLIEEMAFVAGQKVSSRDGRLSPLPRISNVIPEKKHETFQGRLKGFENELSSLVEGQPHVVDKLVRLRARDMFYGYRENPSFMWFLGPPGTGKDTAVRAYLEAVHGDKKAFQSHMYRVDPLRTEGDLWSLLGSATGYVGSNEFPPILNFLVQHSAGRYGVEEVEGARGVEYRVVENSGWKHGEIWPGYSTPDRGIVYFDEFQDWSKQYKNAVAKKAVEYGGYWKINNPNGGLSEIYVPMTIVASSNDGLELVTSREKNGQRFGRPLSYPEMKQKADRVRHDPLALRNSILGGNGEANAVAGANAKGTSEELLNRIPDDHLVLFDPLSPDSLKRIAEQKLQTLRSEIQKSRTGFSKINLSWSPAVVTFLQEYHYVAEDQARPIENRVRSLIEATIIKAVEQDRIRPVVPVDVMIDVVKNSDNTWQMTFQVNGVGAGAASEFFGLQMDETLKDKARQPITDERIDELAQLPEQLKKGVVGQPHVLDKVARAIILSEEGREGVASIGEAKEKARVFMFLGPTSTGKTETSKVIAETLFGSRLAAVTIDCTSLQSIEAMHRKFLGHKDAMGNAIASDFMKHYDRNAGRMVVVLDELANVREKEVLNSLFDLLREPVVNTFSDGRDRMMSNVIFIITGNASQEILAQLPSYLPEDVLREAWMDIYDQLESDPYMRRAVLEGYFTPPFIARVGDDRIFFYKPLGYADVRSLVQMKFAALVKQLAPQEGRRGWQVRVSSVEEYKSLMAALETHGFKVKEQGASIDNYVAEVFGKELRATLLLNKVPSGMKAWVRFVSADKKEQDTAAARYELTFEIQTEDGRTFPMRIDGKPVQHVPETLKRDELITAAHEIGHLVARMALLGDFHAPTSVKILPGVTRIGHEWVYYSGLASSQQKVQTGYTREILIRDVASMLAGTVAENLVIRGGLMSSGRSNDLQRATQLIERGILEFGMSLTLGLTVREKAHLSPQEREVLAADTRMILKEAEEMARQSLVANKGLFVALTNQLARQGELQNPEIQALVAQMNLVRDSDLSFAAAVKAHAPAFNQEQVLDRPGMKYQFVEGLGLISEDEVVDVRRIYKQRREAELQTVPAPENAPIEDVQSGETGTANRLCARLLS